MVVGSRELWVPNQHVYRLSMDGMKRGRGPVGVVSSEAVRGGYALLVEVEGMVVRMSARICSPSVKYGVHRIEWKEWKTAFKVQAMYKRLCAAPKGGGNEDQGTQWRSRSMSVG